MNNSALPRIDFYHLADAQAHNLRLFCCRLAEKAWKLGNRIYIHCDDNHQMRVLDDLMWSYRDNGFLPHAVTGNKDAGSDTPILIGTQLPDDGYFDLTINLASQIPAPDEQLAQHTARIAELINQDANCKQQGRIRYSYYDKHNYPLEYHEITAG